MSLKKLHNPSTGQMRVVGLMSGSGSNLRKIIELEKVVQQSRGKSPYAVVGIFTDNAQSKAVEIGKEFDLPVITRDIKAFYAARGRPRNDMNVRKEFDAATVKALANLGATVAAYAGYMSKATQFLVQAYLGINVHPADLAIGEGGQRKYTGAHAVKDAILAGEKYLRSTMHIIEEEVDQGRILMRSAPVEVQLSPEFDPTNKDLAERVAQEHQNRLKEEGDWMIFPLTLLKLADGEFAQDLTGNLYMSGKPIPHGLELKV